MKKASSLSRAGIRAQLKSRASDNYHLLVAARSALWVVRRVRHRLTSVAVLVALLIALVALGFVPSLTPYGQLAWVAAGVLVAMLTFLLASAYANFLVTQIREEQEGLRRRATLDALRLAGETSTSLERLTRQQSESTITLQRTLDDIAEAQERSVDSLAKRIDLMTRELERKTPSE